MLRIVIIAAMFSLGLPALAAAQEHHEEHHPPPSGPKGPPPPGPKGPPPPGLKGPPPKGPGPMVSPGPGPGKFTFHGRPFSRVHLAPFVYPQGWGYRRWAIGLVLPPLFLVPDYYYDDWAALGLPPPDPGFEWVRYGPDLLLVNVATGQIVDVIYGAFF